MAYKLTDIQKKIGKRIKEKRLTITMPDKRTMTQEDLADAAKVRANHISLIEREEKRDLFLSTVLKICNALGCKLEDLLKE